MRCGLFLSGVALLALLWTGPIAAWAHTAFFAHMAAHMGVVAVAAPLLALGVAGTAYDPVRRSPALFAAIPASMLEFVFVWAWHAPRLHALAQGTAWGHAAEQGTFLFSGLWLWLSAVGGNAEDRSNRAGAGMIGLLLTAMHMTLLGALIALATRPLYAHAAQTTGHLGRHLAGGHAHHAAHSAAALGLTPLQDQSLGGAIMILMGGISYLAGGLWLLTRMLRTHVIPLQEQP